MNGENLIISLKGRFLCKDEQSAQQKPNEIASSSIGGNRKTKTSYKKKKSKTFRKRKNI
jgi:hypothetical protein